jgi:hypothetical protein
MFVEEGLDKNIEFIKKKVIGHFYDDKISQAVTARPCGKQLGAAAEC